MFIHTNAHTYVYKYVCMNMNVHTCVCILLYSSLTSILTNGHYCVRFVCNDLDINIKQETKLLYLLIHFRIKVKMWVNLLD